jgi:hypothetical protein
VRIGRSPGTDFTGALPMVTGDGNGGASDDGGGSEVGAVLCV